MRYGLAVCVVVCVYGIDGMGYYGRRGLAETGDPRPSLFQAPGLSLVYILLYSRYPRASHTSRAVPWVAGPGSAVKVCSHADLQCRPCSDPALWEKI